MDPTPARPVAQRKRSYSTTAYMSLEQDHASATTNEISHSQSPLTTAPVQPTCLLATAVGTQVLTYEFIDNGTVIPFTPQVAAGSTPKQQQSPLVPGQFDGIQMSNERTAFTMACLRWSPNNSMLAVEAHDGRIFLHDDRGKFQEVLVNEPVMEESRAGNYRSAMAWAPKNQRLYFAHGQRVLTWDSTTSRTVETFEVPSRINALAIKTDDALLAIGQNSGALDVVDRTTGTSDRLDTPNSFVLSKLEYSIFSKSILGGIGNDGILRLWDTGSTGSTAVYHSFEQKHDVPINSMTFSPFNRFLICTVGLDKRYTLYDVDQKSIVKTRNVDHALTSVTFKNDGFSMAFGTDQGKVLLYDLRSTNRPISVVDTNVNAPITSIHFQGRRSSTLRRHQTLNGSLLKRQNSAGSKPSTFSSEAPLVTTPMARSQTLGDAPKTPVGKSILSRPAPIKTATGTHPTLSHLSGSGIFRSLRDTQSAGTGNKGIMDLFAARRATDKDSSSSMSVGQDRTSTKVRRPTAPASITAGKSTASDVLGAFQPSVPPTADLEITNPASSGFISMPTTPGRDNPQPTSASYPNSRTVSPFAFQNRQSHSPSDGSSTSSSSVNNTPPGSPGAHGFLSSAEQHTNPLKHHHYSSADSLSKSPSRASRAKRRKSFGTLMASGGVASLPGTPDPLSEEKMELLRGQIVDRVRNVLLDQPTESTVGRQSRSQSGSSGAGRPWLTTTAAATTTAPMTVPVATASAPIRDLWMQAGLGGGSGGANNVGSHASRTNNSILSKPATSTSASTLGLPSISPSSSALAMSLDPPSESEVAALPSSASSSFQSKILEGVIDGCLMEFRALIRNDIQNMHLELLRQFQIQKMEIERLLEQYTDTRDLKEENQRLLEENQRLKMNY
ncbi:Protein nedd1 [Mortierella sp. AD032]|nr:Protein nedd1 [Mortierella sp. AD032]